MIFGAGSSKDIPYFLFRMFAGRCHSFVVVTTYCLMRVAQGTLHYIDWGGARLDTKDLCPSPGVGVFAIAVAPTTVYDEMTPVSMSSF